MINKVAIKISFITFLVCIVVFNVLFFLKHGVNYLHVDDLIIGIPLWSVLLTYTAYGGTNYYYKQKLVFIPDGYENDNKRIKEWSEYRLFMLSRLLRILALMFSMAFPVYLLAYLDNSNTLQSGPTKIIVFLVLSLGCWGCSMILKNRYDRYIKKNQ